MQWQILEDMTENLTSEKLTETANSFLEVWSKIQSTWLIRRLKASVQSKVTDFLTTVRCMSIFKNS